MDTIRVDVEYILVVPGVSYKPRCRCLALSGCHTGALAFQLAKKLFEPQALIEFNQGMLVFEWLYDRDMIYAELQKGRLQ